MEYKTATKSEALIEYERYKQTKKLNPKIDENHMRIRKFFNDNYFELKKIHKDYDLDCELAYKFYDFLSKEDDGSLFYKLCDYDFWKYVAVFDIPNIIADRFGESAIEHFYDKGSRIYPYTLFWYIYLSWQGSEEKTRIITKGKSTDIILQLVERPSRMGINENLYREIMKVFGCLTNGSNNAKLFRLILKRNTEKMLVYRPEIYPGGIESYVKMIYGEYYGQ